MAALQWAMKSFFGVVRSLRRNRHVARDTALTEILSTAAYTTSRVLEFSDHTKILEMSTTTVLHPVGHDGNGTQ